MRETVYKCKLGTRRPALVEEVRIVTGKQYDPIVHLKAAFIRNTMKRTQAVIVFSKPLLFQNNRSTTYGDLALACYPCPHRTALPRSRDDAAVLLLRVFDRDILDGVDGAPFAPAAVVRARSIAVDEERREGATAGEDKRALVRLGGGRDAAVVLAAVDAAVVADEVGRWATSGEGGREGSRNEQFRGR